MSRPPLPDPYSGIPFAAVPLPAAVARIAAGQATEPVWENEEGGVTFHLPASGQYVKFSPAGRIDLAVEADRLRWAGRVLLGDHAGRHRGLAVPELVDNGSDADGSWLVTTAIPGRNAVTAHWRARPAVAAAAIGAGLRWWHDTAPVERCPYSWSAPDRLADIRAHPERHDPRRWHPEHRHLTVEAAIRLLSDPPPVDRLVVCHGDACSPNTLLDDSGTACALVDLGSLGLADRWADLAIATWSLDWNYGPGFDRTLLDAYGIDPDPERTAYYRLLWDLGP